MLPLSSLSTAAYGLRDLLVQEIDDLLTIDQIKIGHPAESLKTIEASDTHGLNLFFYDVNYDGYPSDGTSDNPVFVRMFCLVTALGVATEEAESPSNPTLRDVSKGENELRLVGEVMRVLHEQPFLMLDDIDSNPVAQLQVIPHTFNLDNLNHIWSTQNETSYRLSVAYEMSLAPIPNRIAAEVAPIAGSTRYMSWGDMHRPNSQEQTGISVTQPEVDRIEVDTTIDNWVPHICAVEGNNPDRTLHYIRQITSNLGDPHNIFIAGKSGENVRMYWNIWLRNNDNSVVAWQEDMPDTQLPLDKTLEAPVDANDNFNAALVDPENIDDRSIFQVNLPTAIQGVNIKAWQAVLFAVYEWQHEEPAGSGTMISTYLKSNTLLFYGANS